MSTTCDETFIVRCHGGGGGGSGGGFGSGSGLDCNQTLILSLCTSDPTCSGNQNINIVAPSGCCGGTNPFGNSDCCPDEVWPTTLYATFNGGISGCFGNPTATNPDQGAFIVELDQVDKNTWQNATPFQWGYRGVGDAYAWCVTLQCHTGGEGHQWGLGVKVGVFGINPCAVDQGCNDGFDYCGLPVNIDQGGCAFSQGGNALYAWNDGTHICCNGAGTSFGVVISE